MKVYEIYLKMFNLSVEIKNSYYSFFRQLPADIQLSSMWI